MNKLHYVLLACLLLCMTACAPHHSPAEMSEMAQGKRLFETGYYKRAMRDLLPLACDGNPEAQYAVGYMYYYGYGVAQDTEVGYFWIKRSADQHFPPAVKALGMIRRDGK
jgi:TPR repeat protein